MYRRNAVIRAVIIGVAPLAQIARAQMGRGWVKPGAGTGAGAGDA